jgi:hypothetical protein
MTKFTAFIIGVILVSAVAALIITRQRSEIRQLQADIEFLREARDQVSNLASEDARLSDLIARISNPEASSNEPRRELLRLRGEVARLRQVNDEEQKLSEEKNKEIQKLRQQSREPGIPSLRERYRASGIDMNNIPEINLGATTNDVLAELQRVGAKFLSDEHLSQDRFIQAEIFPTLLTNTNSDFVAIRMEFYFDDGKLTLLKTKVVHQGAPQW